MLDDNTGGSAPTTVPPAPEEARRQEGLALLAVMADLPNEPRFYTTRILSFVATRAARKGGSIALSYGQIARDLKMPIDTVKGAIPKLRQIPGLEIDNRQGRLTVWRVRLDGGRP